MDPMTLMGIGTMLGGAGGLFGSMFGGGGQPMLNPDIQAALQSRGLDINEAQVNDAWKQFSINNPFAQSMQAYAMDMGGAGQGALNKLYGGGERGAGRFVSDVFGGGISRGGRNLLSGFDAQTGLSRNRLDDQTKQLMAQSGLDPSSPAAVAAFTEQMGNFQNQQDVARSNLEGGIRQNELGVATNLLNSARNAPRLAGQEAIAPPLTAEEKYNQDLRDWRNNYAHSKQNYLDQVASNRGSTGGRFDNAPISTNRLDAYWKGRMPTNPYAGGGVQAPNPRQTVPGWYTPDGQVSAGSGGGGGAGNALGTVGKVISAPFSAPIEGVKKLFSWF